MGASISSGREGSLVGVSGLGEGPEELETRHDAGGEGQTGSDAADGCDEMHV